MKKSLSLLLALLLVFALAACTQNADKGKTESQNAAEEKTEKAERTEEKTEKVEEQSESKEEKAAAVETEQAAEPEEAGFTEYPIFEDEEVGFMNVSAVYFQPVPMSNGNESIEGFNLHLECDISALKNDLGYGLGDWVPYLTVDYKIVASDGKEAAAGTFMVMSASDGPHYGANIKLDKADTYELTFTFHNPEENGYLLHIDSETGPGGSFDKYFKDGNLSVTYKGWEYTPQEWK